MEKLSILAVDESAATRSLLTSALNSSDWHVVVAHSPIEALNLLQQNSPGGGYAVVLCPADLNFVGALRRIPGYATTPVLIITSETGDALKSAARQLRVAGWINTPFDARQLFDIVHHHATR